MLRGDKGLGELLPQRERGEIQGDLVALAENSLRLDSCAGVRGGLEEYIDKQIFKEIVLICILLC